MSTKGISANHASRLDRRSSGGWKARSLAGAAVALTGLLGTSVGANAASAAPAAPTGPAGEAAVAADLPWCVRSYSWFGEVFQYVAVENNCGSTYRAKVVVSGGPDSDCYTLSPGEEVVFRVLWGDWEDTVRC